jgi:hypothetical protein
MSLAAFVGYWQRALKLCDATTAQYKNSRVEYIQGWWHVVNWPEVCGAPMFACSAL